MNDPTNANPSTVSNDPEYSGPPPASDPPESRTDDKKPGPITYDEWRKYGSALGLGLQMQDDALKRIYKAVRMMVFDSSSTNRIDAENVIRMQESIFDAVETSVAAAKAASGWAIMYFRIDLPR